jgi:hypothetical protein
MVRRQKRLLVTQLGHLGMSEAAIGASAAVLRSVWFPGGVCWPGGSYWKGGAAPWQEQ